MPQFQEHTHHRGRRRPVHGDHSQLSKLLDLLSDGEWHSTKELARRVGHCFAVAKFKLIGYGYEIERERHPAKRSQHRYRLVDSSKNNG